MPTNLSTTRTLEGCSLRDIIRGLSVEMATGAFILPTFKPKLETDVSEAL